MGFPKDLTGFQKKAYRLMGILGPKRLFCMVSPNLSLRARAFEPEPVPTPAQLHGLLGLQPMGAPRRMSDEGSTRMKFITEKKTGKKTALPVFCRNRVVPDPSRSVRNEPNLEFIDREEGGGAV